MIQPPHDALLIFVKNVKEGKVKTRLAKTIGNKNALIIYSALLEYTKKVTETVNCKKTVFYSDELENNDIFSSPVFNKAEQYHGDLGERMLMAFHQAFADGANKVVIIGSDCYQLTTDQIQLAYKQLEKYDVVIGPADDGGYYLLGLKTPYHFLFKNKSWSTSTLFNETITDLLKHKINYKLLPALSDIDSYEDLKKFRSLLHLIDENSGNARKD